MKILIFLLFLTLSASAQEFVEFVQPFTIPTADGYFLTVEPGDCFPSRGAGGAGRQFLVFGPGVDSCPFSCVRLAYGYPAKARYEKALNRMRVEYNRALKTEADVATLPPEALARLREELAAIEAQRQQARQTEYLREIAEDLEWQRIRRR